MEVEDGGDASKEINEINELDDAKAIAALNEADENLKKNLQTLSTVLAGDTSSIDFESVKQALRSMTASVNVCQLKREALDGVRGNVFTQTPDFSWDPGSPMFLFKNENTGAVLLLAMELMAYGAAFGKQFKDGWDIPELQAWRSPQVGCSFALWPFRAHAMTCVVKDTKGPQTGAAQGSVVQRWVDFG